MLSLIHISFAEERKSRTDQLLFTAPVTIGRIVLGKFAAMAAVFLIPILFYCLFPLIIKASGTAYLPVSYTHLARRMAPPKLYTIMPVIPRK